MKTKKLSISDCLEPTPNLPSMFGSNPTKVFWLISDFYLPKREYIYSSKFKRNFTTPFNEIVASCMRCHVNAGLLALQIVLIGIQYY